MEGDVDPLLNCKIIFFKFFKNDPFALKITQNLSLSMLSSIFALTQNQQNVRSGGFAWRHCRSGVFAWNPQLLGYSGSFISYLIFPIHQYCTLVDFQTCILHVFQIIVDFVNLTPFDTKILMFIHPQHDRVKQILAGLSALKPVWKTIKYVLIHYFQP